MYLINHIPQSPLTILRKKDEEKTLEKEGNGVNQHLSLD